MVTTVKTYHFGGKSNMKQVYGVIAMDDLSGDYQVIDTFFETGEMALTALEQFEVMNPFFEGKLYIEPFDVAIMSEVTGDDLSREFALEDDVSKELDEAILQAIQDTVEARLRELQHDDYSKYEALIRRMDRQGERLEEVENALQKAPVVDPSGVGANWDELYERMCEAVREGEECGYSEDEGSEYFGGYKSYKYVKELMEKMNTKEW